MSAPRTSPANGPRNSWPILLPDAPVLDLATYESRGGGLALEAARMLGPEHVLDVLAAAGIRGRGGAGFPTARKWRTILERSDEDGDRFVVANGAEGEPGSFKDRLLLRRNPFKVLEGVLVATTVLGAREAFVGVKESFALETEILRAAIDELVEAGWADVPISVVTGPEHYLFGEEKALLEVIEGEEPLPRSLPPYLYGLFSASPNIGWSANLDRSSSGPTTPSANPTLVNNVETFTAVTAALRVGSDAYRSQGTETSPGSMLVTISGDTVRDGVAEVPYGTTVRQAIQLVGDGLPAGRSIRAVLSGVATPVLTAADLDTPLTHDHFAARGHGLGAGGFIVFDDTRDMAALARAVAWFLHVESCGQCAPCKTGTGALSNALAARDQAETVDLDTIHRSLQTVDANARCYLPTQSRIVISSLMTAFPEDFAGPRPAANDPTTVAKITDIVDGRAVLDTRQQYKRPDWTYAETPVTIGSAI